jgi:LmbE family N-acetylglucosaminyl deacetylase
LLKDIGARQVLVVVAHPDDAEFGAGGTVALWTADGVAVRYLIVTDGSKGSSDRAMSSARLVETRKVEQRRAADVLGAKEVVYLDVPDGEVMPDLALRHRLTRAIRLWQPDTVITHDPASLYWDEYINHPDHRAVGQATLDAIFPTARDHLNVPDLLAEGLEPHMVRTVLLTGSKAPDTWVAIDDVLERKIEALRRHESQFPDFDKVAERVRNRHREIAADRGMQYAEAFKKITLQ